MIFSLTVRAFGFYELFNHNLIQGRNLLTLRFTYINYTDDALLNIIKNKENRAVGMEKTLKSVGGELISYYGLIGQDYDVMMIINVERLRDYLGLVGKAMLGGDVKDKKLSTFILAKTWSMLLQRH